VHRERLDRVQSRLAELGVDALLLSVGADLPWLTGYEAMALERLTMLVVPRGGEATLVVARLEVPRVEEHPDVFSVRAWDETEDPVAVVAGLIPGGARTVGVGDQTWARFVLDLQRVRPGLGWRRGSDVTAPLRMVKDAAEIDALASAAHGVDQVAVAMRDRPFAGRTEADVSRELVERMLDVGHDRSNFAIVASGPNAASPHHDAGERVIADGDIVLCDFGGTMRGYCSDITRMYSVGEPSAEVRDTYAVLVDAQERAFEAAQVGAACADVDRVARDVIAAAGLGDRFIHRTGHGIGVDAHEDPYLVAGNDLQLVPGHAFSIEPGIYLPGRFGLRLEDIVVATGDGPERLNHAPRDLAVVG
jgi:Xaa-Pro aminopeptidase